MKKQFTTLLSIVIFSSAFGQVGINTPTPTETLDVNGNARVRNPIDIEGTNQLSRFNRRILSDENGVLGYVPNFSKITYGLDNIYEATMSTVISTTSSGTLFLNLSTTITIPAKTNALIVIDYNIPVYRINGSGGNCSYAGITLMKSTNGAANQELEQGSRKFTFASYAGNSATAQGLPVAGKAVDNIINNTNSPITIVYTPLGYTETNSTTVYFGMWQNSGSGVNFNWGRGSMTATSYFKSL